MSPRFVGIRTVHLLVHPGFSSHPEWAPRGFEDQNRLLFRRYMDKARDMGDDELMVAFAHSDPPTLRKDVKADLEYTSFLIELRLALGKRLIVLCDRIESPQAASLAKRIARGRGFRITAETRSVAYGERLGVCVEKAAENFNIFAKFHGKTGIDVRATDFGLFYDSVGPADLKEHMAASLIRFRRLYYDFGR